MLKALRQKKADTLAKANAIFKAAEAANRDLTDAERTEYDALMASVKTMNGDIERLEQLQEEERSAASTTSAVTVTDVHDRAEDKPWASAGEVLQAVRAHATSRGRSADPRLFAAALGSNESVDAEGGFLIPPQFAPGIWQRTYDASDLASRCFDQPMTQSNRLVVNAVDEDSRATGSRYGGVASFWLGEATAPNSFTPKFRRMELVAKKLIALTYATDEQLVDGPAYAAYVDKVVPLELAFMVDNAIFNGPGGGQPLGFMPSQATLVINRQTAGSITNTDIFNMWGRLWAPSRKNAVWFVNQDVEQQLWNLTRGSGTAVELLFKGPGQAGNGQYGTMMGRPVVPVEYAATLGTAGDIVLADLTQYYLARRSDVELATSIHVQFLTDQQAFRWKLRLDGQPVWKKPLTPFNGTNTLAPFVALHA